MSDDDMMYDEDYDDYGGDDNEEGSGNEEGEEDEGVEIENQYYNSKGESCGSFFYDFFLFHHS